MSRDMMSLEQNIEVKCGNSLFLFPSAEVHFKGPQVIYLIPTNEQVAKEEEGTW